LPQVDTATLERRISVERLRPYRIAVNNDVSLALALYEWNAKVAASFWPVLGHLEVLVRNAVHEQLTDLSMHRHAQQPWYLSLANLLNPETQLDIALRNRIAHHEPIHNRPLEQLHSDIRVVSGWVCPIASAWISSHSSVETMLRLRPRQGQGGTNGC
jgi:hypothetical protein